MLGQDASNGHELCVSGSIESTIGLVHASTNDLAILDKDTANRRLVTLECKFGLGQGMSQHSSILDMVYECKYAGANVGVWRVQGLFYHGDGLAHEALMIRPLLRTHVVCRVNRFVVLAVLSKMASPGATQDCVGCTYHMAW